MAVNNGCPECHKTYGQPGSSSGHAHDANGLHRTRTASPDSGQTSPTIFNPFYTGRPRTPANGSRSNVVDRQEIIRRIKSGESRPNSPELEKSNTERQELIRRIKNGGSRPTSPELERVSSAEHVRKRKSPSPRPATPGSSDLRPKSPEVQQDNQSIGMQIERPRSALHRGDFRERQQAGRAFEKYEPQMIEEPSPILSTSPGAPWRPQFPSAAFRQNRDFDQNQTTQNGLPIPSRPARDRAISNASLAASFVYKPPTSPLVQSSRPDTPEPPSRQKSRSPDKTRRHTFSPQSFHNFKSALDYPASARGPGRTIHPLRSEKTFPYQAHQPRRSLNSFSSLPQSPTPGSRRPSFSAESPIQHAPMVGSYEESILRGRMSTIPSRPLSFMAQIGVLGKGNCRSNLRCPPHVSVPFPAVFYSYGSGTKNPTNDQPSPYVGLVDLENNLSAYEDTSDKRRHKNLGMGSNEGSRASSPRGTKEEGSTSDAQMRRRRKQKSKRRSGSPKAPPGGSYRIPQQGQLQIVIKNPNKTAVKLFLVPYDLSDMEPGQKTFIRQRSYSAGPIIDMPLTSRSNLGTDRPEASLNSSGDPNDRPMLRYLIHLHICCPSKGRYFLYNSVRVVFANRVPDGKEKLRNETQLPEPMFSAYKPGRDSNVGVAANVRNSDERRSEAETNLAGNHRRQLNPQTLAQSLPNDEYVSRHDMPTPTPTLPRHFTMLPTLESRPSSRQFSDSMDVDSQSPGTPRVKSPISSNGDTPTKVSTKALPRLEDAFDFRRDRSRERRHGRSESLLSRRLMDFALQGRDRQDTEQG